MGPRSLDGDRAMSESIGIGLLVGMTVVVTAVVGLNVLVVSEDDPGGVPQANFTYDYAEESSLLLVTHSRGDAIQAGRLEFEGPRGETKANWSELANTNRTALVEQGDIIQLGEGNAYGQRVGSSDTITVYYNESGNRTQLDRWDGA
ncbi:type IV pilin N-terminal domain-containing protein [Haloarcula onubensis]|uniref:Type IV pilin N-terminal domain-containing protein n=1 Tax=Haloarcula onubensis TaxID=2950539 RepID=A0ABU2FTS5_9EURY|nr:type IV pilin N-terminal domain-containing protein [Halomicroarcula sp. S3CR25-11]MDS0284169.1 type IV pilin N-terminal domain-containing protein [Halomicroarcula sp. S3CR25-11]